MKSIKLSASLENLNRFNAWVRKCAKEYELNLKKTERLMVAIEEALVNIFEYAYPEKKKGEVELRCYRGDRGKVIFEIRDSGIPFDPRLIHDPDTESDMDSRKIGGLGIYLMKKMVDEINYKREGDKNILKLIVFKDND